MGIFVLTFAGRNFRDFCKFRTFSRKIIIWNTLICEFPKSFFSLNSNKAAICESLFWIFNRFFQGRRAFYSSERRFINQVWFFASFFLILSKCWQLEAHSIIWLYNVRFYALFNGIGGQCLLWCFFTFCCVT